MTQVASPTLIFADFFDIKKLRSFAFYSLGGLMFISRKAAKAAMT
jgi:hypothetical protein